MVEESKNLSLQVISLEKRLKELELLTEDDSGLFPNKHDEQMLDLLRENHFT